MSGSDRPRPRPPASWSTRRMVDLHELRCPVCLDVYKQPVELDCSHTLCLACAHAWLTRTKISKDFIGVACPECNTKQPVTEEYKKHQQTMIRDAFERFEIQYREGKLQLIKDLRVCANYFQSNGYDMPVRHTFPPILDRA